MCFLRHQPEGHPGLLRHSVGDRQSVSGWKGLGNDVPWPGWDLTQQAHMPDGNSLASDGQACVHPSVCVSASGPAPLFIFSLSLLSLSVLPEMLHRPSQQISRPVSPQMGAGA